MSLSVRDCFGRSSFGMPSLKNYLSKPITILPPHCAERKNTETSFKPAPQLP